MEVLEKLKREEAELEKQFYGLEEDPETEKPLEKEVKEEGGEEESTDLSEQSEEESSEEETEESQDLQESSEEEDLQPDPEEEEKPKKKRTSWKQRHINLKTHFDVTVRDLRVKNADIQAENESLRNEVVDISKKLTALQVQVSEGQDPYADVITQEDRDVLGDEAVETMKRIASVGKKTSGVREEALEKELELIRGERARLLKKEQEDLKADATNKLEIAVAKMVPDFESINFDPNFRKHLDKIDPVSGKANMEFFSMCVKAGDVRGTARFYQDFVSQKPKSKEEILSKKITPTGSGSSEVVEDTKDKELHSIGDYEKFMDDVSRGLYKGKEKEARKIEAMYDRVFVEQRFR